MNRSFIFSSNSIRLSWKNWVVVIIILAGVIYLLPKFWGSSEKLVLSTKTDYRLPYNLSNDYYVFTRWSKYACSNYPILVIGDSVVWGQYVTMEETLSHYLNERAGKNIFANMGVDGTHPAAISGLMKYYGKAISNKGVILHLNPLWMSSKRHDLSGEEEFRFNHPRLVPQFTPELACYKPSLAQRIGVLAERNIPFFSWTSHIRTIYFDNMDLQNWTIQNPYKNPLQKSRASSLARSITLEISPPENNPKSKPVSWFERGMRKQNFPWVQLEESFQWNSFKKAIKTLKARNNKVFVILGPFNPYILTEESLNRYNSMKYKMERWFQRKEISYWSVPELPSEYYADASHPLGEGYAVIAEELFETESFREWMEAVNGFP